MVKITDYKICTETDFMELERNVRQAIKDCYQPIGGVAGTERTP